MKKLTAFVLTLVLCVGLGSFSVSAAEDEIIGSGIWGDLNWVLDGEGTLTISGTGDIEAFSFDYEEAWHGTDYKSSIKSVVIESGVTSIGDNAFNNCKRLESIIIPNSVTSIGGFAFALCSALTSITIPDSVTSIEDNVFPCCESLTSISVNNLNQSFCSVDGVLFNKNKTLLIAYPAGKSASTYAVPDSVTSIGDNAFNNCKRLESITIPNSVTSIGGLAFDNCGSLTSITIPDSVTSIGETAFFRCRSLTSITIPDSVTSIGSGAFADTGYYSDASNWENSVLYIGNYLIDAKESLSGSYTVKDGTVCVADGAFSFCKWLESITIPDSVTSIGEAVFRNCYRLTSITLPDSVISIGEKVLNNCDSFETVNYTGTEEQWNSIDIGKGNSNLKKSNIVFSFSENTKDADDKGNEKNALNTVLWIAVAAVAVCVAVGTAVAVILRKKRKTAK